MNVYVSQHIEYMNRKPARSEGWHQKCNQAKDLSFTSLMSTCLALCPVAWCNTLPQFDSNAEIRDEDSRQWQDVCYQQSAICIGTSLFLLSQPELLADGEAFLFEFYMVGVGHCWSYEPTGQQPDASEDRSTSSHRGALLQGMNCCVISAIQMNKKQRYLIIRAQNRWLINEWENHELGNEIMYDLSWIPAAQIVQVYFIT